MQYGEKIVQIEEKTGETKQTSFMLMIFILMNFVITMMSSVFSSILDKISISLDVSVANAGLLNTMFFYGGAFGVPITLIVFRKIERTKMMKIMLFITILMTLALVFTRNFTLLLIIRLIMGISANSYGTLAVSVVLSLTTKEKQGRTMALYITGASLANIVGTSLTRALLSILDWRSIFWILNIVMISSLTYFKIYLPENEHNPTKLDMKNELDLLKSEKTLLVITSTLIIFMGNGAFFNYITPYLLTLSPSLEPTMSLILFLQGIASFIGNLIGGYVSDRIGFAKSLLLGSALQIVLIAFIIASQSLMWLKVLLTILWPMNLWFLGLQLSAGIAQVTNNNSLMMSFNNSALQLGSAIGSSMAAMVISFADIHIITYITLLTSIVLFIMQLVSIKKLS